MALSHSKKFWFFNLIVIGVVVILVGYNSPTPADTTESGRVRQAFHEISLTVAKKKKRERVSSLRLIPVRAGVVSYPDGSKVSLWVPKPEPLGIRSNCFYVDESRKGEVSGYMKFSCAVPKSQVILDRQGSVVVGFIAFTKASIATITSGGVTLKAPITFGYFIFPSVKSGNPKANFTTNFVEPGGGVGTVTDLSASGRAAGVVYTIA